MGGEISFHGGNFSPHAGQFKPTPRIIEIAAGREKAGTLGKKGESFENSWEQGFDDRA
jgi:hypothetical protein